MNHRFTVALVACTLGSAALAQQDGNRVPFDVQRESGIYTTKQNPPPFAAPAPQVQPPIQPPVGGAQPPLPEHIPFGRASPDALIPVPTGPRTTTSAPIPGVDILEASEPMQGDIVANELPAAVANPAQTTPQTGSIFEGQDAAPHPVRLRALNKVTGHATLMTLRPGMEEMFGNLTIHAHVCRSALEHTQPDSAALIEITEKKPEDTLPIPLFSGWMFSSSPSLTALEHPIYDISIVGCQLPKQSAKNSKKEAPSS